MSEPTGFTVGAAALEVMADAALGPDPETDDEAALRLPTDLSPTQVHRQMIQDRLRGARLLTLPTKPYVKNSLLNLKLKIILAETGILSTACTRAGWTLHVAKSLRAADPDFKQRWDDALEFAADAAEAEAFRRGVHGYEKDVYFKGEKVGKETMYSDRMLELTLKARRPDRFRDSHKVEVDSKGGVLVLPAAPSDEGSWESGATAGQAKYREAPTD